MRRSRTAVIIGAGVGGLGAACLLAKAGWSVTVLEKNEQLGGRAGLLEAAGFRFDTGPSWYLMPDVFEHFFELLGEDINARLKPHRLSPSYRIFFTHRDCKESPCSKETPCKIPCKTVDICSDFNRDALTFENLEAGAGGRLKQYLAQAAYAYELARNRFMYKNYDSMRDFLTPEMLAAGWKLNVLSSMHRQTGKYFKSHELQKILEYPAVFVGSRPDSTPALFGILNYILLSQGVYYPEGGMYKLVDALAGIAKQHGARFILKSPVQKIMIENGNAIGVEITSGRRVAADVTVSNAGIHHTETQLLDPRYQTYSEKYWQKRVWAPSAVLIYLGVRGKLPALAHHNLLFDKKWRQNFLEIFNSNSWPADPSLYVCCPSKTDSTAAPQGHENLFVLVPVAPGLNYTESQLEKFTDKVLATLESEMGLSSLRRKIVYKKLFSVKDFASRYNAYQGSALGLAHTLRQTAVFRPNNLSRKVKNLYYVGADTNPGIGLPATLISAELLYKRLAGNTSARPLHAIN